MRIPLLSIILFAALDQVQAQYPCPMHESNNRSSEEEFNGYVLEFIGNGLQYNTDIHCLPVVFHIINDPGFPIGRVHDQLERTNQHLRRTHVDTVNTRALFVPNATDSHIELKLAALRPEGTPFNGMDHIDLPGYTLSMTQDVIAANMFDHTLRECVGVPGDLCFGGVPLGSYRDPRWDHCSTRECGTSAGRQ